MIEKALEVHFVFSLNIKLIVSKQVSILTLRCCLKMSTKPLKLYHQVYLSTFTYRRNHQPLSCGNQYLQLQFNHAMDDN